MRSRGRCRSLGILVEVEEAYTQCPKAFLRSDLWNPERHIDRSELPSSGEILRAVADPELDVEEYDEARARSVPAARRLLLARGALALPGVEQLLHVPPLLVAELEAGEEAPGLGDVVVLDRGLEMLAGRDRLPQLPSQPAEEAHLRGFHRYRSTRRAGAGVRAGAATPQRERPDERAPEEDAAEDRERLDALPALALPVDVAQVEPQGELVEDQRRADSVGERRERNQCRGGLSSAPYNSSHT